MKKSRSRHGSLQFAPRKRAAKLTPSANWKHLDSQNPGLLGFLAYKAGMATALVKDSTDKVRTSKKTIAMPVTILEVPAMKIFSVRFYKNRIPLRDIIVSNEKELKKKLKVPKQIRKLDNLPEGSDDVRVIVYSLPKQTSIKKTPDVVEIALQGSDLNAKVELIKSLIGKELTLENFSHSNLVDVHGVTIGKGFQGPVKRFGITKRHHKSEKGVRKVGSIGPWHPAHLTFRIPMAGQMGMNTRVIYNLCIVSQGKILEKNINPKSGFPNYGNIKSSYIIVNGSVQGPVKRQVLLTAASRPSKKQSKRKLEFLEVLNK
ncbi:50S ribosomal protein L3 [Candidatus Pacearchaeota archaeon]|nr:50S ribosomal protein L3 [Candidatus Pacearchaeota archaeon]